MSCYEVAHPFFFFKARPVYGRVVRLVFGMAVAQGALL